MPTYRVLGTQRDGIEILTPHGAVTVDEVNGSPISEAAAEYLRDQGYALEEVIPELAVVVAVEQVIVEPPNAAEQEAEKKIEANAEIARELREQSAIVPGKAEFIAPVGPRSAVKRVQANAGTIARQAI